jgi:ABC-type Fe3+-hydroxamate transport system substrate-binding protein
MIERTDDLNRTLRLDRPAQRVVCLVPSITETLFLFGAGERVAGITDYCVHPAVCVAGKQRVGGTKNVRVEEIIAIKPDLVIANAEENRRHHIEELEWAGIPVFVTFPRTVDGCLKMMRDVAILTGTESAAEPIVASIQAERFLLRSRPSESGCRILCPIWKNPYMSINRDTFIDSVIRESGGNNIFADQAERYPKFTLEEVARLRPDIIILPTEPYRFTVDDFRDFEQLGAEIPAVANRRIHIVEGELLSWYGPRVARALHELSALFAA